MSINLFPYKDLKGQWYLAMIIGFYTGFKKINEKND